MTSNDSLVHPPRISAWFVELFASPHEADGILGDLAEEFGASVARNGYQEARRRYRRQAWRTITDLALFPLRAFPSSKAAISPTGLMLTAGIGLAGLVMTWPIAMIIKMLATKPLVTRYLPYDYVTVSWFMDGITLLGPFVTGVFVALVARGVRVRSMSAALAMVMTMAVLFAIDRPMMLWLYGSPLVVHVTLVSSVVRWARGILMFGGVILIGAAIGRLTPLPGISVPTSASRQLGGPL